MNQMCQQKEKDSRAQETYPANGLRYWQVGGRGLCLRAGKTRSQKNAQNGDESHLSSARFVGQFSGRRVVIKL